MLDPHAVFNQAALNQLVGGNILGNWQVLIYYFIMLFFTSPERSIEVMSVG
jgi:hypothetical protein